MPYLLIQSQLIDGEVAWQVQVREGESAVTVESHLSTLPAARQVAKDFRADYLPPLTPIRERVREGRW